MMRHAILIALLVTISSASTAAPYVVSGSEVTDSATGLVWRRCPEGMAASGGTCTGTASVFTHEAALSQAASQAGSTGVAWRLPTVKELSSIADKSRFIPAIDTAAFPATPSHWFWSSTPYVGDAQYAWGVVFDLGLVYLNYRVSPIYVRLVRAGQ